MGNWGHKEGKETHNICCSESIKGSVGILGGGGYSVGRERPQTLAERERFMDMCASGGKVGLCVGPVAVQGGVPEVRTKKATIMEARCVSPTPWGCISRRITKASW